MAAVGKVAGAAYGHGESGGGGGGGFLGPRLPAEVEAMARGLQEVGKETFRRLLKGMARHWAFSRREGGSVQPSAAAWPFPDAFLRVSVPRIPRFTIFHEILPQNQSHRAIGDSSVLKISPTPTPRCGSLQQWYSNPHRWV